MLRLYKLVVRDSDGRVLQIHEVYQDQICEVLLTALDTPPAHHVTVTELP